MIFGSPYYYEVNRDFSPGAMSLGFESIFGLPAFSVAGPGNICGRLRIFDPQVYQLHAVPHAWIGDVTGQIALQPLTQANGMPQT